MPKARIAWTPEMIACLRALREAGHPVVVCAERIGVGYLVALKQARSLGLAGRRNFGRITGCDCARQRIGFYRARPVTTTGRNLT
jgi:hypothetical protein